MQPSWVYWINIVERMLIRCAKKKEGECNISLLLVSQTQILANLFSGSLRRIMELRTCSKQLTCVNNAIDLLF